MSDLIAEYKAMLMNADTLNIVYLSAESTDLYPNDGAELVSLTGVNSAGDVVLDMRFDVRSDNTGEEYHGITKDQIAGLPHATDVLAELKHFLTADNGNERYCWSYWFIEFFDQLLGEKPAVNSVKDLICDSALGDEIGIDEYSTLQSAAYVLNIEYDDISKEKLGFLIMQKSLKLVPLVNEMANLKNKLHILKVDIGKIMYPPKLTYPWQVPANQSSDQPIPKNNVVNPAVGVTDDDMPF